MPHPPARLSWRRHRLWIDGMAGAVVGVVVLLASGWLAAWYGLPLGLVRPTAGANLAYGAYSLSQANRRQRTVRPIAFLVGANLAWAALCFRWAAIHWDSATGLELAHLVGEGLFVGGLAVVEWRSRRWLITGPVRALRPGAEM